MIIRFFNILLLLLFCFGGFAQSINEIRKQREKSEKEISYLNKLLEEAAKNQSASTGKLNILQEKISQSTKLINSLVEEVRYLQADINTNQQEIDRLQTERKSMLDMYGKLVYGTWKRRNKTNKLMFIFSSSDFNQAYNRFKYFQQIQEYSGKQLELIRRLNDSLNVKNDDLKQLVVQKNAILNSISVKNKELETEKSKESSYISELQKKEREFKRKLDQEMKNRQKFTKKLNELIAAQNKKSSGSSKTYKMTPEEKLISDDFVKNKGKLPWPVEEGFISEKFGVHIHSVHKRVEISNNGVNITTQKNANVRAVFKGVVSQIWFLPGSSNVVVIQHGDYLTIYPNLMKVSVESGDKVNTKDVIGVIDYDDEKGSVLNFQIWKNTGKSEPEKLNPEYWLAK